MFVETLSKSLQIRGGYCDMFRRSLFYGHGVLMLYIAVPCGLHAWYISPASKVDVSNANGQISGRMLTWRKSCSYNTGQRTQFHRRLIQLMRVGGWWVGVLVATWGRCEFHSAWCVIRLLRRVPISRNLIRLRLIRLKVRSGRDRYCTRRWRSRQSVVIPARKEFQGTFKNIFATQRGLMKKEYIGLLS